MSFLARVSYTSNGSTPTFSFSFPYIAQSHIKAFVDGVEDTNITFPTDNTVTLSSTPANGAIVTIQRVTPTTSRTIDFQDGSVLTSADLDQSADQNFFVAQETLDEVSSNLSLTSNNVYDANNKRIINVANPVNNQDAVTKHYLENTWLSTTDKTNINTLAPYSTQIGLLGVASVISDMNILGTSANVTNMATVASNITDVNSFANRYRITATNPTTSLDAGDLAFVTGDSVLRFYDGTSWKTVNTTEADITSVNAGTGLSGGGTAGAITLSVDSSTHLANNTTSDLAEGTNLYYTDARVDTYVSGGSLSAIDVAGNAQIDGNLVVDGNLTVSGTQTIVNTETINLADNQIVINSNFTGSSPTEDGGIEIERGTQPNKTLVWDESDDKWTVGSETFVADTLQGKLSLFNTSATKNWTLQNNSSGAVQLTVGGTGGAEFEFRNTGSSYTDAQILIGGQRVLTIDDRIDEDNMASNSALKVPSQQSVKAYVDSQVATVDTLSEVLANGNTTSGNNIDFDDNDRLRFGSGNDLQIYHTGTGSYIRDTGTGDLRIESNFLRLVDDTNNATTATFFSNGVNLRYQDVVKFTTTSAGATVSGNLTATGNLNVTADSNSNAIFVKGRSSDDISTLKFLSNNGQTSQLEISSRPTTGIFNHPTDTSFRINNTETLGLDSNGVTLGGNLNINGHDIITPTNTDLELAPNGTGRTVLKGNLYPGTLVFNCEQNSHGQTVKAQPHSANVTNELTLPAGGNQEITGTTATQTLTNKTLTSPVVNSPVINAPVLNTSISGTAVLDEDDMASDSDTKLATQQSIKAYVDAEVASVSGSGGSGGGTPEVYGFVVSDADGDGVDDTLQLTTTNGGNDNISASTYSSFNEVIYASSGISWSIDNNGHLIATI